jgi:hypothetical protein
MSKVFHITRIYADANGDSCFEDITRPLKSNGGIGFLSDTEPVKGIIFREVTPGYDYDFHNAPQRQYIILLDGGVEIETSLGEKRTFNTGEILLVKTPQAKATKPAIWNTNRENRHL